MIYNLWELGFGFAISAAGVGITLLYARWMGIVDVPNHRSSHSEPTPRGGGVALVAAVIGVSAYEIGRINEPRLPLFAVLASALVVLAYVGWLDDRGSVRVAVRLAIHLACGLTVALLVNVIAPVPGFLNVAWLAWCVLWTMASINVVNFMDGIDGMVAFQGVVYGIFLFALLPSDLLGSKFGLILAAACLGFLVWNWAPAKMFMGDGGSGSLGLLFAVGGALALEGARATLVFLPLFPLFFDALVTLTIRFHKGEKLTVAHRQHLYQRIANGGAGHSLVSSAYALATAVGALIAVRANTAPVSALVLVILGYVMAVGLIWKLADAAWPSIADSHV